MDYFKNIFSVISSLSSGMGLTLTHLWNARKKRNNSFVDQADYFEQNLGRVTLDYPREELQVPELGRYKLHNEIDDCIVCDKCAKICPVNCIDIEAIKSKEIIDYTSDNTPKRLYAAKFDIDMSKCCFCGLCTTVCPTECLTMTSDYDFSVFDITEHNFEFAVMTQEEIAEKKKEAELAAMAKVSQPTSLESNSGEPKKVFKPKISIKGFKPSDKKD